MPGVQCRACLSTEPRLIPFDNTSIEGYNQLTSLNVKESDGLPQAVCESCFNNLETFVTFRLNCINSEQILKEEYESSREIQGDSSKNNEVETKLEAGRAIDDDDMEADSFMGADDEPSRSSEGLKVKDEDETMDEMDESMDCVICNKPITDGLSVIVRKKGIRSMMKSSVLRNDGLVDLFSMVDEIILHKECRNLYTYLTRKGTPRDLNFKEPVDYDREPFDFSMKCFICNKETSPKEDNKSMKKRQIIYKLNHEETLRDIVKALKSDECMKNLVILHRIENINVSQIEARYHRMCYLQVMMPHRLNINDEPSICKKDQRKKNNYLGNKSIKDLILMDPKFIENTSEFPFNTHCFFCAQEFKSITKMRTSIRQKHVLGKFTKGAQEKLMGALEMRDEDVFRLILQRIQNIDLVGIGARYHKRCRQHYHRELHNKPSHITGTGIRGRPQSEYITDTMEVVYKYITDNRLNHFNMVDLNKIMVDGGCDMPDNRCTKRKLLEKYGERITIVDRRGVSSYATFHDLA